MTLLCTASLVTWTSVSNSNFLMKIFPSRTKATIRPSGLKVGIMTLPVVVLSGSTRLRRTS